MTAETGQLPGKPMARHQSGRLTVGLTCTGCGHQYETPAREVTRCPACRRSQRIPAALRQARRDQETATQAGTGLIVSTVQPAVMQGGTEDRRSPVAVPAIERPAEAAGQAAPDPDDDSSLVNKTYDAIRDAVVFGRTLKITASGAAIREVERIIRSIHKSDEPSLRYRISPANGSMLTLRLWSDSDDTQQSSAEYPQVQVVPVIAETVTKAARVIGKRSRKGRSSVSACEWPGCRAIPGVSTTGLYRVSSPALDRERILCALHMQSESVIPGAEVILA
jgi:hypothetical protein